MPALIGRDCRVSAYDEEIEEMCATTMKTIFDSIQGLNRDGIGILLVEQNANMALSVADRGYVLQMGRVVLADTAASLIDHHMMRKAYLEL